MDWGTSKHVTSQLRSGGCRGFEKERETTKHILVGGLEHSLFFHILGLIIPTDFHIFQRVDTTNQYSNFFWWLICVYLCPHM